MCVPPARVLFLGGRAPQSVRTPERPWFAVAVFQHSFSRQSDRIVTDRDMSHCYSTAIDLMIITIIIQLGEKLRAT